MPDTTPSASNSFVTLGHISRPHGVHGAVVITPYTDNPDLILSGRDLELLSPDGRVRQPVPSLKGKVAAQGLIVKMKNITTREAAQALKGWTVGMERRHLPEIDDDEIYWADLLDMTVRTSEGLTVGRVSNLMEAGAGLILVVASVSEPDREHLIPFHEAFLVDVDQEEKILTIAPPPGLLDL